MPRGIYKRKARADNRVHDAIIMLKQAAQGIRQRKTLTRADLLVLLALDILVKPE